MRLESGQKVAKQHEWNRLLTLRQAISIAACGFWRATPLLIEVKGS